MGHAPENSLEAIEHAAALGADAVELDVRQVGGALVCAHDPGEQGPAVGDAVELARRLGMRVELDLKGDGRDGSVEATAALIAELGVYEHTWVSAFHPYTAWRLRWADPRIVLGWSVARSQIERPFLWSRWVRWLGAQVIEPQLGLLTTRRLERWRRLGLVVEAWCVPLEAQRVWIEQGVSVVVDRLEP